MQHCIEDIRALRIGYAACCAVSIYFVP